MIVLIASSPILRVINLIILSHNRTCKFRELKKIKRRSPCYGTHFFFFLKILMISHTIRPNTIASPNTATKLTPAIIAAIRDITAIAIIKISKIVNKIITITPSIIENVSFAKKI